MINVIEEQDFHNLAEVNLLEGQERPAAPVSWWNSLKSTHSGNYQALSSDHVTTKRRKQSNKILRRRGSLTVALFILVVVLVGFLRRKSFRTYSAVTKEEMPTCPFIITNTPEAIECLINQAELNFETLLQSQSKTPEEAMKRYKEQYGRYPPLGFAQWVRFALDNDARIIDEYGQIEADLMPFRSIPGQILKARMDNILNTSTGLTRWTIKDGKLSHAPELADLQKTLQTLIEPAAPYLSDVTWLQTIHDGPRVLGPKSPNSNLKTMVASRQFSGQQAFQVYTERCPINYLTKSNINSPRESVDICQYQHDLNQQSRHGFYQSANSFHNTTVPIFSLEKAATFEDIIGPPWCYGEDPYRLWQQPDTLEFIAKDSTLYWRGSSTGHTMTMKNWWRGHRQRLLLMVKKWRSISKDLESGIAVAENTIIDERPLTTSESDALSRLNEEVFDIALTGLTNCGNNPDICNALVESVGISNRAPAMDAFQNKFLLDVDGNGMSCRFYRLLDSNSAVFKQTIWGEWHDDRIVPWLHYIPVSLGMQELPQLLDFFLNHDGGLDLAEKIAYAGKDWARTGLRKIDITIYYYRLLMELGAILEK